MNVNVFLGINGCQQFSNHVHEFSFALFFCMMVVQKIFVLLIFLCFAVIWLRKQLIYRTNKQKHKRPYLFICICTRCCCCCLSDTLVRTSNFKSTEKYSFEKIFICSFFIYYFGPPDTTTIGPLASRQTNSLNILGNTTTISFHFMYFPSSVARHKWISGKFYFPWVFFQLKLLN